MEPKPPIAGARLPGGKARSLLGGASRFALPLACALAAFGGHGPAQAQKVRISDLSDVSFGLISNLQADARRAQNICVFSQSTGGRYSITAAGSGAGSSFALSNGSHSLAYDVEWSDQSGQTSGTRLAPTVAATGRASSASHQTCNSGPATSASLIVILRSTQLMQAREGNYSGSLTLVVAAE